MKIAHIAPMGANRSGLYEAARDFMRADYLAGHQVFLIDKGFSRPTGQEYSPINSIDDRGGFAVSISNPSILKEVDIIIDHAGMTTEWLNISTAPIINIVHGRPVDSFGMEYWNNNKSYTYEAESAKMDRVKKVVYFWPEFKPFWDSVFPEGKSVVLEYPTMDEQRFTSSGVFTPIEDKHRGEHNILICDSWGRKDIDMFEIINGVIQAGRDMKNFKLHFYGVDNPIKGCWDLLYKEMYKLNCMGELCGRMSNMEMVYKKMDVVLTPHRIITRVVGEALLTGKPVIASDGCKVAQFTCNPHDPHSVSKAIKEYINSDKEAVKKDVLEQAKKLHLHNYSREMNKIYNEIMEKK